MEFSTSEIARVRPLVEKGVSTRQQLDQAQANFDRDKALLEIEAEIRRAGGRVERTEEEREAVTSIEARLRQARAVKSCRRFIASEIIRKFMCKTRAAVAECDYCFDAFKRKSDDQMYCSRTCEKFAMRGKYD